MTFNVLPGKEKDLETFFSQEYAPAMCRQAGFLGVSLLREADAPTAYKMVIAFETPDLAAAWRASDGHKALSPRFKSMYSKSRVTVYEVVVRRKEPRLPSSHPERKTVVAKNPSHRQWSWPVRCRLRHQLSSNLCYPPRCGTAGTLDICVAQSANLLLVVDAPESTGLT